MLPSYHFWDNIPSSHAGLVSSVLVWVPTSWLPLVARVPALPWVFLLSSPPLDHRVAPADTLPSVLLGGLQGLRLLAALVLWWNDSVLLDFLCQCFNNLPVAARGQMHGVRPSERPPGVWCCCCRLSGRWCCWGRPPPCSWFSCRVPGPQSSHECRLWPCRFFWRSHGFQRWSGGHCLCSIC